jgi:hypothetical protein
MDEDAIRRAVAPVLVNATNYPDRVTPHILGQDMTPLIEKVVARVMRAGAEQDSDEVLKRVANRAFQDGVKAAQQAVSDVLTRTYLQQSSPNLKPLAQHWSPRPEDDPAHPSGE